MTLADRATSITHAGTAVALDALGRHIYRQEGALGYERRGYSGPGDSLSWSVSSPTQIQRQIGLPGGVVLTAETGVANKWSIPNLHGDIAWVTDQTGVVTGGPFRYDPFGKPVGGRVGVNVIVEFPSDRGGWGLRGECRWGVEFLVDEGCFQATV
jgi:hypothetical protein